jgi:endonuclease YncB( thermonuclease family)
MRESFEGHHESGSHIRTAIMAIFLSLAPASAKAELPECHDIGSRPTPAKSVHLDNNEEAEVVCIVDGDTFDVRRKKDDRILRIRIWGVDCPESRENAKCMKKGRDACQSEIERGKKAKERTRKLLNGKKVFLMAPFGNNGDRKLAYVSLHGKDLGIILIGSYPCLCEAEYRHELKDLYREKAKKCRK